MYAQGQQEGQAQDPNAAQNSNAKDEEVTDVDFEEVK